ncbi:hypothetical protein GE061_013168 [Apolygus lucorum]|uniref:Lipase domain-containing protein n=1 Tax=Apolygus lucorum TaxID=248454 RepID=A0A6A4JJ09_APOLU|nr:hypothetical protein GE061_013168 [Apolygus lucorum]
MKAALSIIFLALSVAYVHGFQSHEVVDNGLLGVLKSLVEKFTCRLPKYFGSSVKYVLSVRGKGNFTEEPKTPYSTFDSEEFFDGNLDPQKETVILIHGFLHGCDHKFVQETTATYLKFRRHVQVIAVCWDGAFPDLEKRVGGLLSLLTYPAAYKGAKCVGKTVASFIQHLHDDLSVPWNKLTVVAHSLGTQVAGAAGNILPSLKKIIALDPAWKLPGLNNFHANSAKNIIVLHTSGILGTPFLAGTADFYANYKNWNQPGCESGNPIMSMRCNHYESVVLFNEALRNPKAFKAKEHYKGRRVYFSPETKVRGTFTFDFTVRIKSIPLITSAVEGLADVKCTLLGHIFPTEFVLCNNENGKEKNWTEKLDFPSLSFKLNKNSLFDGNLDPKREIVFIIHGFLYGCSSTFPQTTKAAYFEARPDVQVVLVCWSLGFPALVPHLGWLSWGTYKLSSSFALCVGKNIGSFMKHLHTDLRVPWKNMTLVAYSLGTQVAGAAGGAAPKLFKLIALDPATTGIWPITFLDSNSAKHVVALHTSNSVGKIMPIGTLDFFANDGFQPGCSAPVYQIIIQEWCNHYRAFLLFQESLKNPKAFLGRDIDGKSKAYFSPDTNARGVYYFETTTGKDKHGKNIPFSLEKKKKRRGGRKKRRVRITTRNHAKKNREKLYGYGFYLDNLTET